jgi:alpha-glucuronidase
MPGTPLIVEFQITQEYLGNATHVAYLAPLFEEVLDADTYGQGNGSTVARVVDGTLEKHALSGMAGVANIGNDRNWCGHPLAQSNWYAFGRLAWDHSISSADIAEEWIRMTFNNSQNVVRTLGQVMLRSREILVNYMTPLGLHHIMGWNHHYGPAPWIRDKHRADWTSVYYHRADSAGIGFDRSATGSNSLEQYALQVRERYNAVEQCPEEFLLWFHHVSWDSRMKSGKTLWEELCHRYYQGADSVKWMQRQWASLEGKIDSDRHAQVSSLLNIQQQEAVWWRNACVLYFQTFSNRPIPKGLEKPDKTLEYYQSLEFPFAPGIKPRY